MRMIVIGAGPIGGIIGGRLARAGNDMTFVDIDKKHVAAIGRRASTSPLWASDGQSPRSARTRMPC